MVDIVSAPAPRAAVEPPQRVVADDESYRDADAVEQSQAASVEQTNSPAQPITTAAPAIAAMAVAGHSAKSEVTDRRKSSVKRQLAPIAIASNSIAAPDADNEASTTSSLVSANVPSAWKNRLLSHLDRYKRYPDAARAQRAESTALLSFGMDRNGRVLTFYLVRSSGCPELDDGVLTVIQRASPLPAAPPELHEQIVQLVVPVRFSM